VIKANPYLQNEGTNQLNPIVQGGRQFVNQVNPIPQNVTASNVAPSDAPAPSAADIALGLATEAPSSEPATTSPATRKNGTSKTAADIALGLDTEEDAGDPDEDHLGEVEELDDAELGEIEDLENVEPVEEAAPPTEAEALLADKAQLNFDFDRVLASHGRTAALGIVRSVMPHGTKGKLKDLESLPVELIPAAIVALQAAETD
jgi:hypothetical protein